MHVPRSRHRTLKLTEPSPAATPGRGRLVVETVETVVAVMVVETVVMVVVVETGTVVAGRQGPAAVGAQRRVATELRDR